MAAPVFQYVVILDENGNPIKSGNPLDVTAGSGGTSQTDDDAFTPAASSFTPVGGVVTADSVDSGDGGAFAMLANRQQKVTLYDSSGNELSVGGGTQYTEGDTDASITGTAMLFEGAADALVAATGDATNGLDVDVTRSALPTGAATSAKQDTIIGHIDGVETLLTAIDGHVDGIEGLLGSPLAVTQSGTWDEVGINDSGNSITVDAPQGTPVFVRLSDGTNPIATLPVSLASVPSHAVTNAGTFPVQVDGSALTALQLIDNLTPAIVGPETAGKPVIDSYTQAAINLGAGNNQSLISAPGANKQIWVYGLGFSVNVAGTVSFQDEDDTAISGIMQIGATGGFSHSPSGNFAMPMWKLATNKALEVDVVTSELDGWISYGIVSV